MSLVLTILDHDGPANPGAPLPTILGKAMPASSRCGSPRSAARSPINDYQSNRGARGARADRNVIIPLGKPPPS